MKATINEIQEIVYKATKKILKESLFHRTYREGSPENYVDVIKGNGWSPRVVDKHADANGKTDKLVLRVYESSDAIFSPASDSLPFDELVADLNEFFQWKKMRYFANSAEEYNGEEGAFIIITRK